MVRQFLQQLFGAPSAEGGVRVLGTLVFLGVLSAAAALLWLLTRQRGEESRFRVREADKPRPLRPGSHAKTAPLAEARLSRVQGQVLLEGVRLDGPPHELLGIPENASRDQVQKAYREMMKRFHPDRVGRPGSREWQDAQKIAEAINRAKEKLLSAPHRRS